MNELNIDIEIMQKKMQNVWGCNDTDHITDKDRYLYNCVIDKGNFILDSTRTFGATSYVRYGRDKVLGEW